MADLIDRKERNRRNTLTYDQQMAEAQASCVPCKLCGGKAVITDAGPGYGYNINCENWMQRKNECFQGGTRISGWAYNVADRWNELNAIAALAPAEAGGADWRNDPTADERWNAGCDFAMTMLCQVVKADPDKVSWDAATETLEGDVSAVIGNILTEGLGEDWRERTPAADAVEAHDEQLAVWADELMADLALNSFMELVDHEYDNKVGARRTIIDALKTANQAKVPQDTKINWGNDPDAIVEDDEPQIGRDYA